MKGYFVTATDTDAGKTVITTGLLTALAQQGHRTLGFKPVASGCQMTAQGLRNDDALALMQASSVKLDYTLINPYAFEPAIAPHIAAGLCAREIKPEAIVPLIRAQECQTDYILVEGVGGWLVPLNEQQLVADLAHMLGYKIILVVAMRLGCINHALLTAQAIEHCGMELAGWIANCGTQADEMFFLQENVSSLQTRLAAPFLGSLPDLNETQQAFSESIEVDLLR